MADMVKIRSATDMAVSLFDPTIPVRKTLEKRNATVFIEREKLIQLYYNSQLETALREGILVIEDKNFLYEVGYLSSLEDPVNEVEMTPALMKRCISVMPLSEVKTLLKKLSKTQIEELAEYAIANNSDLKMDRIDILSTASQKNILKAIELYKRSQED